MRQGNANTGQSMAEVGETFFGGWFRFRASMRGGGGWVDWVCHGVLLNNYLQKRLSIF